MPTSSTYPRVAVIYGERHSPHHELSESSAKEFVSALSEGPHEARSYSASTTNDWYALPTILQKRADLVFLTTHGTHLLPGDLERLLLEHQIPFVGADPLLASLTSNPYLTSEVLRLHSIPTPRLFLVSRFDYRTRLLSVVSYIKKYFGFPLLLWPVNGLRSFHAFKVSSEDDLISAFDMLFSNLNQVVVSSLIPGTVFRCPVLDHGVNESAYPLVPVSDLGETHVSESLLHSMRQLAVAVHKIMRMSSYSEVVFSYSHTSGFLVLAVNTIPSLYDASPLRRSLSAAALSVRDFVARLTRPLFKSKA